MPLSVLPASAYRNSVVAERLWDTTESEDKSQQDEWRQFPKKGSDDEALNSRIENIILDNLS